MVGYQRMLGRGFKEVLNKKQGKQMTDKKQKQDKKKQSLNIPFDEAVKRLLRAPTTTNEEIKKKKKEK